MCRYYQGEVGFVLDILCKECSKSTVLFDGRWLYIIDWFGLSEIEKFKLLGLWLIVSNCKYENIERFIVVIN